MDFCDCTVPVRIPGERYISMSGEEDLQLPSNQAPKALDVGEVEEEGPLESGRGRIKTWDLLAGDDEKDS